MPRTLADLKGEVLAHGFSEADYGPRIDVWLNEGLSRVARRVRIPQLEAAMSVATVAGTAEFALPANLIRVRTLRIPADADPLEQLDLEQLDHLTAERGRPRSFALAGQNVRLYPTPDRAYALELRYWADPATLAAAGDVPAIPDDYADLLVTYALWKGYRMEDDFQAAAFYRQEFTDELAAARSDIQHRSTSHVRQVQGLVGSELTPRGFIRP